MKISLAIILTIFCTNFLFSQINTVKVKLIEDGVKKDINGKFKVYFISDMDTMEPLLFMNGFVVPEFKNFQAVDLIFTYKEYTLHFNALPVQKLITDWIINIDNHPKEKKVKSIYAIDFIPKDGKDGTRVTVTVPKM
jgi:hypothetical protein